MEPENSVSDSWEDIDESELEKRLEQERIRKDQEMSAARQQNGITFLSNGDNEFRPRILQRPKPAVTILKRPDSSPALSSMSQGSSKPQMKTLEQREKEYAEARLRILGSARCDDSSEQSKALVNTKSSSSSNLQNFNNQQKIPDNVIRLPNGPTNDSGFNIRR